ncbi:endonuclease/exonuclease/phosphatase family protein [Streptomyces sp. H10-C2]|uniref:endonuclease/exonuclease/phosphatase family protein n=1 Tax=unclassified Streptomyces TaxID=2593676 RepID=UPI0024B8F3D9|nr:MULTISPECIES: endonuclease/exonuclease/phosphatase family protein [unclassified Streptomyces]MDJ0346246.1 endonuclease/exonuclease/phosphatase family protein [Streptomyces sp. PH10-H1]MDJ0371761.1 endonuclease/exonuclease/phosphatase family protein [Streptomyces sp. H10-C2]
MTTRQLRIVSWNIREGVPVRDPGGTVDDALAEIVARHRPDVLAVQEAAFGPDGGSPLLDAVAPSAGLPHRLYFPYSPAMHVPGAQAGLALLSREPWTASTRSLLPNPGMRQVTEGREMVSWDKGMLFGRLDLGGQEAWIGCVHLHPFHLFGTEPDDPAVRGVWAGLAEFIRELPPGPLVVCADLNSERRSLLMDRLPDRPLQSAVTAGTSRIGMAVDDVLFGPQFILQESAVHYGFSDHALCVVQFELKP